MLISFTAPVCADGETASADTAPAGTEETEILSSADMTIVIHTAADLLALAEKCTLDTWSYGKTVILEADIDLTGVDYTSIPVFSGTFDGRGHTIGNLRIAGSGSSLGLFRHIGRGGQVRDLTVTGTVSPDGIREKIGGIAGQNSGTITGCCFKGSVAGETMVGGIAGENDAAGIITDCFVYGSVTGKTKVGGIVGNNAGSVFSAGNAAEVNTLPVEFSASSVVGNMIEAKTVEEYSSVADTVKDIGGIAGLSSGVIRDCHNDGAVGYIHIGYNIGGIVGRHSGSVKNCINTGVVYGRRNTGGIVGEMEPYTAWIVSEDALTSLRDELDALQGMTNTLLDDVKLQSHTLSDELSASMAHLDAAETALNGMLTATTDFINGNIDAVNEVSVRISEFISGMEKVTDEFSIFFDDLNGAAADIAVFSEELKLCVDEGVRPSLDTLSGAMTILSDSFVYMQSSLIKVSDSFYSLKRSLGDPDTMYAAMQYLSSSFTELSDAVSAAERDMAALTDNLYNDGVHYYDSFLSSLRENLGILNDNLAEVGETIAALSDAVHTSIETGDKDPVEAALADVSEAIRASADSLCGAIQTFQYLGEGMLQMLEDLQLGVPAIKNDLSRAGGALSGVSGAVGGVIGELDVRALYNALGAFSTAMDDMSFAFGDLSEAADTVISGKVYADAALEHFSTALGAVSEATDSISTAVHSLARASDAAKDLVAAFAAKEPVRFVRIDEHFSEAQSTLFTELKNLSASVNVLLDTTVSDLLVNDLRAVSDQLFRTFGVFLDLADTASDVSTDPETYRDDVSVEEKSYSTGVTEMCRNSGRITSDYNAGGIAGNISVEVAFDLEDDLHLSGIFTKSAKHLIYAVLADCESYGTVETKYAGAGGIVGNMDYGLIRNAVSGGVVMSTDGDYVGGIAGYSAGTIDHCMARVRLSGKNYIGGIAGRGSMITGSFTITEIGGASERVGAICGAFDGEVLENYFCTDPDSPLCGGIDGISYAGKAEPVSYDELLEKTGDAALFSDTIVTFVKDGETIAQLHVPFGGAIDVADIPVVADRDGMYWVWDSFDRTAIYANTTVGGKYCAPRTTIATEEEIPLFLVEGSFYAEQKLTATEWTPDFAALGILDEVTDYAAYKLSVNDYDSELLVRMRHDASGRLYLFRDGVLDKLSFTVDGTYIVFTVPNNASIVFIDGRLNNHTTAILVCASAVFLAIAGGIVIGMLRRKTKGQKRKRRM